MRVYSGLDICAEEDDRNRALVFCFGKIRKSRVVRSLPLPSGAERLQCAQPMQGRLT
jgi:hypothetical protein